MMLARFSAPTAHSPNYAWSSAAQNLEVTMNIKRNQQVDGSPRIQRRRGAVITSAVAMLSFGCMFGVAQPASATVTTTCTGSGYKCDTTGYGKAANKSYWTMAPGHNCTNYVAYRLIQDGMPPNITWLHNGGDWAREARKHHIPVDKTPTVGSVAQWNSGAGGVSSSGHVAYVTAVSADSITVAEDNYPAGPNQIRVITRTDPGWPSNFIHFSVAPAAGAAVNPTADQWQVFVTNYQQAF